MFLGEYQHSVDEKGRMIIPSKFRDALTRGAYIAKGDNCLSIYTFEEFEEVAKQIQEKSRESSQARIAARSFFAGASEVILDKQGRIQIPQNLREYAGLEKEITVVGIYTRIEVWDVTKWNEINEKGEETLSETEIPGFGI